MAEFLEERLSMDVRMGATYADDYRVEITQTAGGAEYRKLTHPYPMRSFTINFTMLRSDLAARVLSLYHRVFGKYAGFRVKFEDDFTTAADGRSAPTKDDQTLPYISSGVYQLRKVYGLTGAAIGIGRPARAIYQPVTGTTLIAKNGTLVSSGVTVDTTTGRVTISPPPSYPADTITGGCEFDIPCRFNSSIEIAAVSNVVRDCGSVEVIELLSP